MALSTEFLQIGSDIIGAAFEVRKSTGKGMRECYYRDALVWELKQKGYDVLTEVLIPAIYKGSIISNAYKADILVDNKVVIEVKAIPQMSYGETRQIISYLKLSELKLGYLINFGVQNFTNGKLTDPHPYNKGIYRIANGL